ncbi:MAG: alpha-2-macroglobulin [Tannerellaceae bacterium]|nr:alpha-2-macroglobulin [Tannerellaceae bacterium]
MKKNIEPGYFLLNYFFLFLLFFTTVLRATPISNENKMDHTAALIKSLIGEMKGKLEVDEDRFPDLIGEVESYLGKQTDTATVALLHSMLAEMYNHYWQINKWKIERRTPVQGFVPDDIREWAPNLFTGRIKEELDASLEPEQLLRQTGTAAFKDIMSVAGETMPLRPTLYEFLAFRAIDILPSDKTYQGLIAYYEQKNDIKSLIPVLLAYGRYRNGSSPGEEAKYEAFVDSLINVYRDKPYVVEVIQAKLELLQNKSYKPETADSVRTLQYQLCKDAIARYPDYERIGIITNRLAEMEEPVLQIQSNNTVYPGRSLELTIHYTHIPHITVQIYRSKKTIEDTLPYIEKKNTPGELVKEISFTLECKNSYTSADSSVSIRMDEPGLYEYVITSPGKDIKINNLFSVTRLALASRTAPQGTMELLVTDYLTGKPVCGATVTYYTNEYNALIKTGAVKTGKDGLAALPERDDIRACQAHVAGDSSAFATSVYTGRRSYPGNQANTEVRLLTDRGIYRPGQTVFFKGIAYTNDTDNPQVAAGKRFEITLRDANYREVATKSFTSNGYGSFTGEFTLPGQALTGQFTLVSPNGSVSIRVEEYKRPTFKIELDKVKGEVAFGDEVEITGKAQTFSGVALQQADITYRIIKRPFWFRFYHSDRVEEQVAQGKATINGDGTFSFTFRPEKSYGGFPLSFQSYDVKVSVTDSKNETQEALSTFSVGDRSMILSTDIKKQMAKESAVVKISAMTLNGEETPAKGTCQITTLEGKTLAQGTFSTDTTWGKETFGKLPSGRLRLRLTALDSKGRTIDYSEDFILYGTQDKRPPVFTHTWVLPGNAAGCLPGEEATILFGTSDKKAYILYELFTHNKNVARQRIELSNENRTFRIPFLESYGDGITASFTFVKEGKLYTQLIPIQKRLPDKSLTIKPETFRNRLLPGSSESWTFRIQHADSTAASAEVLAGMYDAALDKIMPFAWYFSPAAHRSLFYGRFAGGGGLGVRTGHASQPAETTRVPSFTCAPLDWQGMLDFRRAYATNAGPVMMRASAAKTAPLQEAAILQDAAAPQDDSAGEEMPAPPATQETPPLPPALRTNFNETAFFFPMLTTDREGTVSVRFTIPESHTAWKLQALAHTKDVKSGWWAHEVVTQKPLMILPNLPRFVRSGDEVSISAQIINLSDKATEGLARLELFNPANDEPLACPSQAQKPFSLQPKGMETVSWTITIPPRQDLTGIRIMADSETGSDGEQHLLPVLPNELLVTESSPFFLLKEGEQQISVAGGKASATRRPYALTLEYSDNPAWYAVQALPAISRPDNDNVISWFAAWYSNTVAAWIAQSNPRIKKVTEQWAAQGGTASARLSNLEKNEELKNVLLQETPWALDAQSETEQKQRLSLLFDVNSASSLREAALNVLLEQQHESGGWGWFKGFWPNHGTTLFILNGMAQLTRLSAVQYGPQEKEMQAKALDYLDNSILQEYHALRKAGIASANYIPSARQVNYLYVRSLYRDIPEKGDARESIRFFTSQAEKHWAKASLYEKGQIALLMHRNGKKDVAAKILAWLRKTATTSPGQGMYWANNKRENNFFHSPLDVHALLMAAFAETGTDTEETDRMKQWLLNRKQTQRWETVPSTVNAVYSILSTGTDWLTEGNKSIINWGDKTFDTALGETATGYIKEVVRGNNVTTALNAVSIRKRGNAPAWGAVYSQYFESVDRIEKQTGALSVEKKLFIETGNGALRQITPLTPGSPLRTGCKVVVRLTLRTDREMEYVSLKDTRPGCFEPASQLSGYRFMDGLLYYHAPRDASEHFYFDRLPAGTHVIEYQAFVSRTGTYAGGIATLQCQYAPEFVSHTEGSTLIIRE